MTNNDKWCVRIIQYSTGKVDHVLGPEGMSRQKAEKVDDGVNRKLDHERFYTDVVRVGQGKLN